MACLVIFSLVYIEKLPWQKIGLNWESGFTDVWLKWDPPVGEWEIFVVEVFPSL